MTKGEWVAFYRRLRTLSNEGAKEIHSLPARQRGPVVSALIDSRTGQGFIDNNKFTLSDTNFHPILLDRHLSLDVAGIRMKGAGKGRWVNSTPGAHAEVQALNQALWAREAAGIPIELNEFWMVNRWLTNSAKPAPRCGFCKPLTSGVNVLTD